MKPHLEQILAVTRVSVHGKIYDQTIEDQKSFYLATRENGFSGLFFQSIPQENLEPEIYKRLEMDFFAYVARDAKQAELVSQLQNIFKENQIKFIFLKGVHIKKLYPQSYMRAMGDIDVLIEENDLKKVHQLFKAAQITCTERSSFHDVFWTMDELVIEVHPKLKREFNNKLDRLVDDPWAFAHIKDKYEYQFDPAYEICYIVYHLAKHLQLSGIGLRSILDVGIFIRYYEKEINQDRLEELLSLSQMTSFFQNMVYLNQAYFGLENQLEIMKDYQMDEKLLENFTDFVAIAGIHGTGSKFNHFTSRLATSQMEKKGKMGFLFQKLFPSYYELKGIYPFVGKSRLLYPIGWIMRLCRFIFLKPKSTIQKLKEIQKAKEIEETKVFFEQLGL